jgi:hypothetical protein
MVQQQQQQQQQQMQQQLEVCDQSSRATDSQYDVQETD